MFQNTKRSSVQWLQSLTSIILVCITLAANSVELINCHDGDTCKFDVKGEIVTARFTGIDAPEIDQEYGKESLNFLNTFLKGKNLKLACYGSALGKRKACDLWANDQDVQLSMVQNGMAWDYPKYSKNKYKKAQEEAKLNKKGLWSTSENILSSPYCFRWIGTSECNSSKNKYQP